MAATNRLILDAFESDILRPEHVERVIRGVVAGLQPSALDREARRTAVRAELATIDREIERLTAAVASGGTISSLVAALKTREGRR